MTRLVALCILLCLSLTSCDSGGDDGNGNGNGDGPGNGSPALHTMSISVDGAPATVHTVRAMQMPGGVQVTAEDTVSGRRMSLVLPEVDEGRYGYDDAGVSLSYQSGDGSDPTHFFQGIDGEVVITESNAEQITGSFDVSVDNAANGASKRLLLALAGSFVLEADGFDALVTDDLDKGIACFLTENGMC